MARMPDGIVGCAFFLYANRQDAEEGNSRGATGFFVSRPWETDRNRFHLYAVTAKHNILRCTEGAVIRANTLSGALHFIETNPTEWTHAEGDDICVCQLSEAAIRDVHLLHLPEMMFVTREHFKADPTASSHIGLGDEVVMIGRLISHDGRTQNHPSARFGNISMLAAPMRHPGGYDQESFAVDMRSIAGFSGSPAFVYWTSGSGSLAGLRRTQNYIGLLGVDWGNISILQPLYDVAGQPLPNNPHFRLNTSISGVVPAWRLTDLLDSGRLKEQRACREKTK